MELNVNSPAYFTQHYGVDDEVYRFAFVRPYACILLTGNTAILCTPLELCRLPRRRNYTISELPWSKCCATIIDKYGVCWWISI